MIALAPLRVLVRGEGFTTAELPSRVEDFLAWLGGPCLLRVPGRDRGRSRIVAALLHGNEPSGVLAMHDWLRSERMPAVDALLFIAASQTALARPTFGHRFLEGRADFNRCWLPPYETPEGRVAHEVLHLMRECRAECLVDLHNNTGHNPPYGVGPVPGAAELNLVSLFADRFVHSPLTLATLVEATRDDFPSVTIECGRSGDPAADAVARRGLELCLERATLEPRRVEALSMRILVDPVRVAVRRGVELAFGDGPVAGADFTVAIDIDRHNFERVAPGTPLGWLGPRGVWPVEARGETGRDTSGELFEVVEGRLQTRRSMIPIMMTTNRSNALADCLFYVVEEGRPVGRS